MIAQIRLSCHAVLTFFDRIFSVEECDGISRLKALYHAAAATDLVGIFFYDNFLHPVLLYSIGKCTLAALCRIFIQENLLKNHISDMFFRKIFQKIIFFHMIFVFTLL